MRVLEDFSYALRDLRIIIRLKLLMFSEGIGFQFVRHVVQNVTTLTTLKEQRLILYRNAKIIIKANEKSASNKSLSFVSLPLFKRTNGVCFKCVERGNLWRKCRCFVVCFSL